MIYLLLQPPADNVSPGQGTSSGTTSGNIFSNWPEIIIPSMPEQSSLDKIKEIVVDTFNNITVGELNEPDVRQTLLDNFNEKVYESEVEDCLLRLHVRCLRCR